MYLFLRWRSNEGKQAPLMLASLVYAFAPYRFFNMTVRAAFSEHVAFVFVPLAVWGLSLLIRDRRAGRLSPSGLALLAISFALILLTNLPAAASVLVLLFLYSIARKDWLQVGTSFLVASSLAVGLAAFYLLPVATFYHDAQLGRLWVTYPFAQSSPILGIFTSLAVMINTYNLIGLLGAGLVLVGVMRAKVSNSWKWPLLAIVLLQLPPFSFYLFLHVFPFTLVQLPARLTVILLIVLAILWHDRLAGRRSSSITSFVVLFWSVCMVLLIIVQLSGIHLRAREVRLPDDPPEYATRWSPPYDSLAKARMALDTGCIARGATIVNAERAPYADTIVYDSPNDAQLTVHRAYWPLWEAKVDGYSTEAKPDSFGRFTLNAPAGRHTITTELTESTSEVAGRWLSLATLGSLLGYILLARQKRSR
jgi:hypothetical protein